MALIPIGSEGLVQDTETGLTGTPGGGFPRPITMPELTVLSDPVQEEKFGPEEAPYGPQLPVKRDENPDVQGDTLWMRRWKLTIGTQEGDAALDLSELYFEFHIDQAQFQYSVAAKITVFNPGENVLTKMQKELTHVYLEAGYFNSTQYGKVFGGQIAYFQYGRRSATDTFVEIHAISNDQALTGAVVNTWLPAGHTKLDVVKAAVEVMNPFGIAMGQMPNLGDEKSPRGRVLFGMATDVLRDSANTADASVFIDPRTNQLHMLGQTEALLQSEETVPILNARTGLIDIPTQTMGGGVDIRCLLNPRIAPGSQVRVAMKDIVRYFDVNSEILPESNRQLWMGEKSLDQDGYYVIVSVQHWGQNFGNPWYSDLKTRAYDVTKNPSFAPRRSA